MIGLSDLGFSGEGLIGDGIDGDGNGIAEEGGFGISLGRLGSAVGIGGILRRFSTEFYTSFRMN
ncbi:hypothetical protein ABE237_26520 [Brevibacillus formosus]|uniref:Uncharacterized protein n=1 Tax=Brevibacillus formosus TaxID=54913 RepID=A0A837KPR3_9BACL|nr:MULTISPECIES: hypothetical protein [Brevibacillus]KLH99554.1 hypothetical protein AA984_05290 [Brevibacillus formosus]MBG9940781.1 hypothetical protein [Brevibacillus formosus]MBW5466342.1 hypothetical protein [Brevibacillus formosus]MED1943359.1 hypothetical protein [Brevibacillus formosus]MED1959905.1 hypothetical protein [Brevibacillus formosus]